MVCRRRFRASVRSRSTRARSARWRARTAPRSRPSAVPVGNRSNVGPSARLGVSPGVRWLLFGSYQGQADLCMDAGVRSDLRAFLRLPLVVFGVALLLRVLYIVSIRRAFFFDHLVTEPQFYDSWAN